MSLKPMPVRGKSGISRTSSRRRDSSSGASAVARELGDRCDDLALGLVEVAHAAAQLALDDAVLFELAHELVLGLRVLQHVLHRVERARRLAHADAWAPHATAVARAASRRER